MPAGKLTKIDFSSKQLAEEIIEILVGFYETDYQVMYGLDDFDEDQMSFWDWLEKRRKDPVSETLSEH